MTWAEEIVAGLLTAVHLWMSRKKIFENRGPYQRRLQEFFLLGWT